MPYIISSGESSDGIILENDSMTVLDGGVTNKTTVNSSGCMYVSGGVTNKTTVNSGGCIYISSGGTTNSTTVNSSGGIYVSSGGTANNTTVSNWGFLYISSGGTANSTTLIDYGFLYVYDGGTVDSINVESSGQFSVYSGGTATNINLSDYSTASFCVAPDTWIQGTSNGVAFEIKDAHASGFILSGYQDLTIFSGGMAEFTTLNSGSEIFVYSGGTANSTTVNSSGYISVSGGGTATNIDLSKYARYSFSVDLDTWIQGTSNGVEFEIKDACVSGFTISKGGSVCITSGGTANSINVESSGQFRVTSGGTATNINLSKYAGYYFAVAPDTYIQGTSNGVEFEIKDACASGHTIRKGGSVYVSSGGTANSTTVDYDGAFLVAYCGTANSTTVNSGGYFCLYNGGTANSTTICSGGSFFIYSGSITGRLSIENGANVSFSDATALNFDLTQTSAGGGAAFVNGLSQIKGTPVYTLTVGAEQETGAYLLARNAGDFDQTFSVVNTSGEELGALPVGQSVEIGNTTYKLHLDNDLLLLTIGASETELDTVAPTVFNIELSNELPTFRPVTLIADIADDVELKSALYRIGEDGEWTDYVGGVTVYENTTVYFKGIDASGNESEAVSRTVSNIEQNTRPFVYVYLDFDGERTAYNNRDLNLSFSVSVGNPGYSDEKKQAILNALSEKYGMDGVIFTLTRPENTEYSTVYFGKSNAFNEYGEFFGVAETIDTCNKTGNDDAFVLLNNAYSTEQIISVAETMLDHILGDYYCVKEEKTLRDYAVASYLLSTQWAQHGPYNKYLPIDPTRAGWRYPCYPTGCTNTATAQIINYWIEKGSLDFSLSLNDTDSSQTKDGKIINSDPDNVSKYGYLSFEETNKLLADYKVGDEDSIAALSFAVGVIQGARYGTEGTSTAFQVKLYLRSGFQDKAKELSVSSKNGKEMTESGLETLIRELLAGRVVGATVDYPWDNSDKLDPHAVVIDGYNSATGEFHLNFGWSGMSDRWYTLNELNTKYGISSILVNIMPEVYSELILADLTFEQSVVNLTEDVVLHFSITNAGKVKSEETTAYVYCGDKLLFSEFFDFLYIGETREFSCAVKASDLSLGANAITVQVDSQKDAGGVSSVSGTVRVYDGAITDTDNTWQKAASGGTRTRIAAEYDAEGNVAKTVLAEDEYIGARDLADFREVTLEHAGKYTFTLSGFTTDLELALYSLTAKNNLKLIKSLAVFAPDETAEDGEQAGGTGILSGVPLEKGTYYISVKAVYEETETPGDSDYRLCFSGTGYLKADNSDDWADLEQNGVDGAVRSVGLINDETAEIVTEEWVGLGDVIDYQLFLIPCPSKVSFTVTSTDSVSFTIYEIQEKTKNGVTTYSLKSLQSTKVKAGATENTQGLLLPAGNTPGKYCFSVQSTNAAKGGSADYAVSFHQVGSVFYTQGDSSDDWGDIKKNGKDGAVGDAGILDGNSGVILEGWVGFGDEFDYRKITLESAAKLFFQLSSSDAAKFTVYRLVSGKKGWSLKSLQSTGMKKPKKDGTFSTGTKSLLLEKGTYYISMQSTNAKKGGSADYRVKTDQDSSTFFTKGDNSDDWADLKTKGADGAVGEACTIADGDGETLGGWVGFGDAVDYKTFTMGSDAKLSFSLGASDAAKFTVWKLNAKTDKNGVTTYSLKSMQSTKLAKNKKDGTFAATTKTLLLDRGTYYFSMESTNAKKGGSADYAVGLNADASVFYVDADNGANDWLYTKKDGLNRTLYDSEAVVIHSGMTHIRLDRDNPDSGGKEDFVGYGDEADYLKIRLETDATLSFTATAADACRFVICSLTESTDKKGNAKYSVKALQTTKLSRPKGSPEYAATTKALSLAAGEYYISMQSTNAKSGGAAYYNVSLNTDACSGLPDAILEGHDACALTMPESFEMTDNPGDGLKNEADQFAALSGAGAFDAFTSQRVFEESGKGILASL